MGIRRAFKTWAHPRLRGEHDELRERGAFSVGSSPLTRGAPRLAYASSTVGGLIPAYAGSTLCVSCKRVNVEAHPRLRGEHFSDLRQHSPPRRLIPAYAGSTAYIPESARSPKAHPRLRGEHSRPPPVAWRQPGSSPLTRGALFSPNWRACLGRLIPAYAGSTMESDARMPSAAAHPRLRGEHYSR